MYNVLIVDDEYYVRLGLRNRVDWAAMGLAIAGEAGNGMEALEIMRNTRVDILLTDICMPEMDGFDLISGAKQLNPSIRCVILSGHDDFAYAKNALRLGVVNYIQKPLDDEELEDTLREVIELLNGDKSKTVDSGPSKDVLDHMNYIKLQQSLNQLINGQEVSPQPVFSSRRYALILLHANIICTSGRFEAWARNITLQSDASSGIRLIGSICPDMPLRIRFLACGDALDDAVLRQCAARILESFQTEVPQNTVYAAISSIIQSTADIPAAYREGMTALKSKVLYRETLLTPDMLRPLNAAEQTASVKMVSELREVLGTGDRKRVQMLILSLLTANITHINTLETILRYINDIIQEYRVRYEAEPSEVSSLLSSADCLLYFDNLEHLRSTLVPQILDFFFYNESFLDDRIVGQVQYYIRQNLSGDLKVSTLAGLFYLSPNHLSYLFHKETGYTLSDFIESIRMERARALLSLASNTVQEVAAQVGYPDAAYFSRVFRKVTGRSPQRYQAEFKIK